MSPVPTHPPGTRHEPWRAWGWYLFVVGAFIFLTVPRMAQRGMFLDGVTYAAIARNLAQGIGSFWSPAYTATLYPAFHEQPPLGLALEAAAFWLFGDYLFVERLCSFLVGILIGVLIVKIWLDTTGERSYGWLPLVFWLLPSTVTWVIVNNMLENTQALFTTAAVFAFVRSLQVHRLAVAWALLSALCVVCAVLTKGPVGLFPLLAPVIAVAVMRDYRTRAVAMGVTMIAGVAAGAALILVQPDARSAIRDYWDQQLGASLSGARGGGRWAALLHHLTGGVLLRMGGLVALAYLMRAIAGPKVARAPHADTFWRWSWFFLLLALAGSVPVAFSAKIVGHYFVPSAPIFACGCAMLSLHALRPLMDRWRARMPDLIAGSAGVALIVISVLLASLGRTYEPRDREWMTEYDRLSTAAPRAVTVGTCESAGTDWSLHAYLQRFFRISLETRTPASHRYFLELRDRPCDVPAQCRPLSTGTRMVLRDCARGNS